MKKIQEFTPRDIDEMDYNQLIGITHETNRPPGGINTVKTICRNAFILPSHKILEIGTSTGFTAIEVAKLTGAKVTGIDINPTSLQEATHRAKLMGVERKIKFEINDATDLPYSSRFFDLVFCGNVTSYLSNRDKALSEYIRVLKNGGTLAAVPMYYLRRPSDHLINLVSEAIKFRINPEFRKDWAKFFDRAPLTAYFSQDYKFDRINNSTIERFTLDILSRPHLNEMNPETRERLSEKYSDQIKLFAENLSMMGYTILLLGKEEYKLDRELFTGSPKA